MRSHFRGVFSDLALGASQIGLTLTFLAYQTWLMSDAILRTLGRLFITHRNLLEWVTAAQSKFSADPSLPASIGAWRAALSWPSCRLWLWFLGTPELGLRRLRSLFSGLPLLP